MLLVRSGCKQTVVVEVSYWTLVRLIFELVMGLLLEESLVVAQQEEDSE